MPKTLKRLLSVLISMILLVWFFSGDHAGAFIQALSHFTLPMVLIATLGFISSYLLRALRVYDEFRHDIRGRFATCIRIVLMHNAMVNVVPFRGGEAAFPLLLQRHFGTPMPRAVASLLWFRLQDAVIVGFAAILLWPSLPLFLRIAGTLALLTSIWLLRRWAHTIPSGEIQNAPAGRLQTLRKALGQSIRQARRGWLWTFANWSVKLLTQAWLLATLLDTQLSIGISGALGAELAAILPVQGVAGFGTYEAGAAAALAANGISFSAGLQAALALHLFVIGCAVTAGMLAALWPETRHNKTDPLSGQSCPPPPHTTNPPPSSCERASPP